MSGKSWLALLEDYLGNEVVPSLGHYFRVLESVFFECLEKETLKAELYLFSYFLHHNAQIICS